MKVTLNKDKHGMLFIDGLEPLTYDNPGPINVDLKEITPTQFNQLAYSLLRGAISVDTPEVFAQVHQQSNKPSQPTQEPQSTTKKPVAQREISQVLEEQELELKKLLTKTISTIKKTVPAMRAAEVRKLLELELANKKRKSLVSFLEEAWKAHEAAVVLFTGPNDVNINKGLVKGGLGLGQYSQNLSDIVDSEITAITIKTTEER